MSMVGPEWSPARRKNTVDHVVTEHGIAEPRRRSLSERARKLIEIAHPKFHKELTAGARRAGLLH